MKKLAAVVVLLLASLVAPSAGADTPPTADWKQDRYDETHSGFNPAEIVIGAGNVASLTLQWVKGPAHSNPLVVHGKVLTCGSALCESRLLTNGQRVWQSPARRVHAGQLFSGGDRLFVESRGDILYLDLSTGGVLGKAGFRATYLNGVYHAGLVIAAGRQHALAVDPTVPGLPTEDQVNVWFSAAPSRYEINVYEPTVAYNRVYLAGCNDLIALREDNGRFRWAAELPGDPYPMCAGTPVAADGRVVVAGPGYVAAYDGLTGTRLWTAPSDEQSRGTVAAANGLVYRAGAGSITAYRLSDGSVAWSAPASSGLGVPTVANGLVYLPGSTGLQVYAADTGSLVTTVPGSFAGEAVVSNGNVVVNCYSTPIGPGTCVFRPAAG